MALLPHAPAPPSAERALPVVSRRPVLDRTLRTVGFELVFHDGTAGIDSWKGELNSERHPTYLGVTPEYLLEREPLPLDPDGVVLELAGHAPVERRLLDRLMGLRSEGFRIVLDDFSYHVDLEPLLARADAVKLDVVRLGHHETLAQLERLRGKNVMTLVEGVDSEDVFEVFRDAGVDLFQGLFYERPNLVAGGELPVGHAAALGALHELQSKGADFEALEEIIRRDVALSYRLLRHVNSAFFGISRTVGSLREALMLLGTRAVRQWAVALVLSGLDQSPHALLSTALVRARTCELVLAPYDREIATHGFTAGLFSLLDAVLGAPMDEILAELPLAPAVELAITAHEGVAGKALQKAIAFERGDFNAPELAGHARNALTIAYSDAVRWADSLL
ncbi:MAG: EAL and HDOD domain-containing protein [Solirubrobacteraceae bacterium]